jgi:DNA modification methylase
MINNSAKDDTIYEPFAGSGTTIIAAESTGRVCLAMEIDPRYCDVIVERWQRFTGKDAVLDGGAASFGDVRNRRAAA